VTPLQHFIPADVDGLFAISGSRAGHEKDLILRSNRRSIDSLTNTVSTQTEPRFTFSRTSSKRLATFDEARDSATAWERPIFATSSRSPA
jgi:hypothetical protein